MRATGQIHALTGSLEEHERRLVAARAILGEWLGGSGGGWQDSGGVWPGMKLIDGVKAGEGDPEFGISRGRLLPNHEIFNIDRVPQSTREKLQESLVLVHGGMAQNVGPILEMVTEKYLLRSEAEWHGRRQAIGILDEMLGHLEHGDIGAVGACTTRNFDGPIQTIIPWASNLYTETLIRRARAEFGERLLGLLDARRHVRRRHGIHLRPEHKAEAQSRMQAIMSETKRALEHALPFAMEPVVYDFAINEHGTLAALLSGEKALMPAALLHACRAPACYVRNRATSPPDAAPSSTASPPPAAPRTISPAWCRISSITCCRARKPERRATPLRSKHCSKQTASIANSTSRSGPICIPAASASRRIACRPPAVIEDAVPDELDPRHRDLGLRGAGRRRASPSSPSRPASAAAGRRALASSRRCNPFCKLGGRHRTFLEVHLAKSRRVGRECGTLLPHIVTTSYLTHEPIEQHLAREANYGYPGPLLLSPGRIIGLRMVPMERDLRFAWEEMPQQMLDEQAAKGPRKPARGAHRLGRAGGRRQRLHRQPAAAVPASGRPLV